MQYNDVFRKVIVDKFKCDIKKTYQPDHKYINQLIASLNKVEANSYNQSHVGFISEYKYLESVGSLNSIEAFVNGCLYQLLWINTILESGKFASTEEELEEEFDYLTPSMLGNPWTLHKVTKNGVCFRGDEPFQESRVIFNSDNIIEIALELSTVVEKNEQVKSVATSGSKASESSLFKSKDLEIKCLNVLKEIEHPVLDVAGRFIDKFGMKGAIVIWYDYCKKLGFISNDIINRRGIVAKAVMNIIPGLSIEGSTFEKPPIAKKYKDDIEHKLAQISLK
ncbi:MAG TPA: hypothetical protein DER05_05085 [Lutibacter sp.]|nr:hypothetical protein [Lutibacter sp.]